PYLTSANAVVDAGFPGVVSYGNDSSSRRLLKRYDRTGRKESHYGYPDEYPVTDRNVTCSRRSAGRWGANPLAA
ncbi:MAG: hypothetical protein KJN63_08180, partial [Acidimicrobiia bacterium]|nr:hypothetical protein [Acidimicrobiia bacterium]